MAVYDAQASEQRPWDLDAAASRLVAELLKHDPACRLAVRGSDPPVAAVALAAAGQGSRLSFRGNMGVADGSLHGDQLALTVGNGRQRGGGSLAGGRVARHVLIPVPFVTQRSQQAKTWVTDCLHLTTRHLPS